MKKNNLADFLFEAATLKRLQRTGWQILGGTKESIADHSFMVCVVGFILAKNLKADIKKVLLMALFHDFNETRTGDIYKLADLYVKADDLKAAKDSFSSLADKDELIELMEEYKKEKTLEAKIVHDADTLALCLELKQILENGNLHAREWFEANLQRLRLKGSVALAKKIKTTSSQNWWKKERNILHQMMEK